MPSEPTGFLSRSERQKDESLCGRYRRIGIAAVAAAQSAMHQCSAGEGAASEAGDGGSGRQK
ncbi:MAG: hypothetical protein VYD64_02055 [Pseudomonadota bacterium]|nr:hypothetical protein [Pseudomonadota bacterium]